MNKMKLLFDLAREAVKRLPGMKPKQKVGHLGFWEEGTVEDHGDCYVAFINVNGQENAVAVRSVSQRTAKARRKLIIQQLMQASRSDAQSKAQANEAVQLIARTQGDKTVEYD